MKPEGASIKLNLIRANAQFVRQVYVRPLLVPILGYRQRISLSGIVFHFRLGQTARQIPIGPVHREIKSIFHLVAEFVTGIPKKDFRVFTAMLTKALARSESNRTIFVELPLHRAAAHVATEEAVTSAFKPDLKWRTSVPGKRHEIDRPA